MMTNRRLNLKEIKDIYRRYLRFDFNADERRPFWRIAKHYREHRYEGFGGYDEEGRLLCYAFFFVGGRKRGQDRIGLLDYLAVVPEHRDEGAGSTFLQYLPSCLQAMDCVIVEVENPEYAVNADDQLQRDRRMAFYLRNGFLSYKIGYFFYDVDYELLSAHGLISEEDWKRLMRKHWGAISLKAKVGKYLPRD